MLSDSDGAAIGELQMIFVEAALECQARDVERILEAIEFFFFNGEKDRGFIEQGDGGTASDGGDTENTQGGAAHRVAWTAKMEDSTGMARRWLPSACSTVASRN